jgi:hypothetical protein
MNDEKLRFTGIDTIEYVVLVDDGFSVVIFYAKGSHSVCVVSGVLYTRDAFDDDGNP